MLDQLIELDKSFLVFLNNLGSPSWDSLWLLVTDKLTFVPMYIVLLYLMCRPLNKKGIAILFITIGLMILFTDQVSNLFKLTFERLRPCSQEGVFELIRQGKCRATYGFFSGHSSNSMATAIFVGLMLRPLYNKLISILIIWSIIVGYSRIYLGLHYPLDVLCGLSFGVFSGFLYFKVYKELSARFVQV